MRIAYRSTISPRSFSILTAGGNEDLMEFGIEFGYARGVGRRPVVGPGVWCGDDGDCRVDFAKVILCGWPERLLRLPV